MEGGGGGMTVRGRVEIDTRQPFGSVKEAVMLFGEKILAGEVYGNKFKEMQNKANKGQANQTHKLGPTMIEELQETKQNLHKAMEDTSFMAHCLTSIRQELENTRKELHQLKSRSISAPPHHSDFNDKPEVEEIKFVENTTRLVEAIKPAAGEHGLELQKKRSVKFASPPLLTKTIVTKDESREQEGRKGHNSSKKTKKKPLVPLIGGLFQKKK